MFKVSESELARKSRVFRYLFYLISGCRFIRFRSWKDEGEPNPFVEKTYRHQVTERVEFVDIFEDCLDRQGPNSGNPI